MNIGIYDRERCVCDAVRFRNRIGIDIMKEVLREYPDDIPYPSKLL